MHTLEVVFSVGPGGGIISLTLPERLQVPPSKD